MRRLTIDRLSMLTGDLTLEESMSTLKLAMKWNLTGVRAKTVAQCDKEIQEKSPVEKILLAKKYGVAKWLKEGCRTLSIRNAAITDEERDQLGWETYARILVVREKSFALAAVPGSVTSFCNSCRKKSLTNYTTSRADFDFDAAVHEALGDAMEE
jgi:hypothetical protein